MSEDNAKPKVKKWTPAKGTKSKFLPKPGTDVGKQMPRKDKWADQHKDVKDPVLDNHPNPGQTTYTRTVVDDSGKSREVSVTYNEKGYPNFASYGVFEANIGPFSRSRQRDFMEGRRIFKAEKGQPEDLKIYVWHHLEDGRTLLLVPRYVHDNFPHAGGFSKPDI